MIDKVTPLVMDGLTEVACGPSDVTTQPLTEWNKHVLHMEGCARLLNNALH